MTRKGSINLPDHGVSGERMSTMAAEFKTIETQEELDRIITERLDRQKKSVTAEVAKQYEGFMSPDDVQKLNDKVNALTTQIAEKDTSIADLTAKNKAYEIASVKAKVARECGIPAELAERLAGTSEEEFRADAENLAKFVTAENHHGPEPSYDSDAGPKNGVDAALGELLNGLTSK